MLLLLIVMVVIPDVESCGVESLCCEFAKVVAAPDSEASDESVFARKE